jgi:ribosome-binding factor A
VYVSVLGGDAERTLEALRRAAPFLRRILARRAGLRFTPDLRFVFDPTLASGSRIEELLRETHAEADEPAADPQPDDAGEEE